MRLFDGAGLRAKLRVNDKAGYAFYGLWFQRLLKELLVVELVADDADWVGIAARRCDDVLKDLLEDRLLERVEEIDQQRTAGKLVIHSVHAQYFKAMAVAAAAIAGDIASCGLGELAAEFDADNFFKRIPGRQQERYAFAAAYIYERGVRGDFVPEMIEKLTHAFGQRRKIHVSERLVFTHNLDVVKLDARARVNPVRDVKPQCAKVVQKVQGKGPPIQ